MDKAEVLDVVRLLFNVAGKPAPWEAQPLIELHKAMAKLYGPSAAEICEKYELYPQR